MDKTKFDNILRQLERRFGAPPQVGFRRDAIKNFIDNVRELEEHVERLNNLFSVDGDGEKNVVDILYESGKLEYILNRPQLELLEKILIEICENKEKENQEWDSTISTMKFEACKCLHKANNNEEYRKKRGNWPTDTLTDGEIAIVFKHYDPRKEKNPYRDW